MKDTAITIGQSGGKIVIRFDDGQELFMTPEKAAELSDALAEAARARA